MYFVFGIIDIIFYNFINYFWFYDYTYKYIQFINTFSSIESLSSIL